MPVKVVDASAIGALIHAEADAENIETKLAGMRLVAPQLLEYELDNICVKKTRANPTDRNRLLEARAIAADMPIALLEVDHDAVITLAVKTGLTAYDAAYLWLARHYRAELVTLDKRLQRASGA